MFTLRIGIICLDHILYVCLLLLKQKGSLTHNLLSNGCTHKFLRKIWNGCEFFTPILDGIVVKTITIVLQLLLGISSTSFLIKQIKLDETQHSGPSRSLANQISTQKLWLTKVAASFAPKHCCCALQHSVNTAVDILWTSFLVLL